MFYIIVEGEEGKSAHTFWSEINKQLLDSKATVVGVPGSGVLYFKRVKEIVDNLDKNSKHAMLLIFDKAPGTYTYTIMMNISKLLHEVQEKGMSICCAYTQDFCFEEWIIASSADEMFKNNKYRGIIKEYYDANKNWTKTPYFIEFINEFNGGRWLNREQAASILLRCLKDNKHALIDKRRVGYCWTGDELGRCQEKKYGKCDKECKNRVSDAVRHTDCSIEQFMTRIHILCQEVSI